MSEDSRMAVRRHELYEQVIARVERTLGEYEVAPMLASIVAGAVADCLADVFGGQMITFPKDYRRKLTKHELEVYDDWRAGLSWDQLASKYGIAERSVRRVVGRIRAKLKAAREASQIQGQLGLLEPAD